MVDDPSDPLRNVLEKREAELAAAKREIARKDQIIAALQQRLFGNKSERTIPTRRNSTSGRMSWEWERSGHRLPQAARRASAASQIRAVLFDPGKRSGRGSRGKGGKS
jgi:hypothetical protein